MGSANERRRYYVTPSLIGRAHTQNDPCIKRVFRDMGISILKDLKPIALAKLIMNAWYQLKIEFLVYVPGIN